MTPYQIISEIKAVLVCLPYEATKNMYAEVEAYENTQNLGFEVSRSLDVTSFAYDFLDFSTLFIPTYNFCKATESFAAYNLLVWIFEKCKSLAKTQHDFEFLTFLENQIPKIQQGAFRAGNGYLAHKLDCVQIGSQIYILDCQFVGVRGTADGFGGKANKFLGFWNDSFIKANEVNRKANKEVVALSKETENKREAAKLSKTEKAEKEKARKIAAVEREIKKDKKDLSDTKKELANFDKTFQKYYELQDTWTKESLANQLEKYKKYFEENITKLEKELESLKN
jgi:hypothetical protein